MNTSGEFAATVKTGDWTLVDLVPSETVTLMRAEADPASETRSTLIELDV